MPLSEHEKRLLDEIEQTLRTDDPGLASSLHSARPPLATRTLLLAAVGGLVLGIVLITVGLQLHRSAGPITAILGVLGFAFLVAGIDCGLRVQNGMRAGRGRRSVGDRRRPGGSSGRPF
jgi:hypothetical protein